jgi:5-hydroxyisourate hydrolase-like protein (transthyretin family)
VGALCAMFAFAVRASAATITGTVTNGTTHTPAAGDTVTLIALDQSMREIAKTKTDGQGRFSIDAPDPGMHLLRIDHQGAGYFQPAPPNTPNVNAQVYDVAAVVAGVSTVANVMRVETDQQGLRVTQSFFIKFLRFLFAARCADRRVGRDGSGGNAGPVVACPSG